MEIELYRILKNKKTGKLHCPICWKILKKASIDSALECNKCEKYYANPDHKFALGRKSE